MSQAPKQIKLVTLSNRKRCPLYFKVSLSGPFSIKSGYTNSEATINQSVVKVEDQSYHLVPDAVLDLKIKFDIGSHASEKTWPTSPLNYVYGLLTIEYSNKCVQHINLEGHLMRPYLEINKSGFEPTQNEHFEDFGECHIRNKITHSFFLSNRSHVPANWSLSHVSFPKKEYHGHATVTILEKEDLEKTDEQSVWEFSVTEVSLSLFFKLVDWFLEQGNLNGPSIPLNDMPESSNLSNDEAFKKYKHLAPQKIMINFRVFF